LVQAEARRASPTGTTVAEYKALSFGAKEAIWLRQLMGELRQSTQAITLCCDNQSAIKLSHNPTMHQRTKHVKLAWHLVEKLSRTGMLLSSLCALLSGCRHA